jgi:PPM family protein phosphatase
MVLRLMALKLSAYGLSDTGLVRQNNEDVWGCVPEHHLYILADGMGGHQAGEVAAREAVLYLCSSVRKALEKESGAELPIEEVVRLLRQTIEETNHFVYEISLSHELLKGMGTTLCILYFHDEYVVHAHVGDSRIYRLRNNNIEQLTQDHSLLRELVDLGKIKNHEVEDFLYKNIITRAIGTDVAVEPAINISLIQPHDIYLLCSDGLSDLLSKDEIEDFLRQPIAVEEKVRTLIAAAKQKGGYDNVTVVLVEVIEENAKEDSYISR